MRYLVTGAQGFTGRFLVEEILRADPCALVFGMGRSPQSNTALTHHVTWRNKQILAPLTSELRSLHGRRYEYIRCALEDRAGLDALLAHCEPDIVIHLASALRDDAAQMLIRSNVLGTASLLNALASLRRKPLLIFGSSGSVYGTPERLPLYETQPCAPLEPYAMSKLAAELVARIMSDGETIPTIWARIFNIAGPAQEERHVCGRFAAQAASIVIGYQEPIIQVGDLRPKRDFIDVRDVARALRILSETGVAGEIYNVASGTEVAIGEILERMLRRAKLGTTVSVLERYNRTADVPRAFASIEKLQSCGFTPHFTIDQTIADLLDYYLSDVAAAAGESRHTSDVSSAEIEIPSTQG